jgi:xylan 1,4-beta-xylosidase
LFHAPAPAWSFSPNTFQQAAGLLLYYNATKFHYLYLTEDETSGRHLRVMSCVTDVGDSFSAAVRCRGTGNIELRWTWITSD